MRLTHVVFAISFVSQAFAFQSLPQSSRLPSTSLYAENLVLDLTKPLGLVLEEQNDGSVFVHKFADRGSAVDFKELQGATLLRVQGQDVYRVGFEATMEAIAAAPNAVQLEFRLASKYQESDNVTITVQLEDGTTQEVRATVGANLRNTLYLAGVPIYTGLQNLQNCGGGGQCGLCAFDIVEDSEGCWEERLDYENKKLAKYPDARLTCVNSIQGPVTLKKTKR